MAEGLTISDALALAKDNDGMFAEGGGIMILFLFFILMMGGGGMWGGAGNVAAAAGLTRAEMQDGFNFSQLDNAVRTVQATQCSDTASIQQSLCQGFGGVQQGFMGVDAAIANIGYQMKDCCYSFMAA